MNSPILAASVLSHVAHYGVIVVALIAAIWVALRLAHMDRNWPGFLSGAIFTGVTIVWLGGLVFGWHYLSLFWVVVTGIIAVIVEIAHHFPDQDLFGLVAGVLALLEVAVVAILVVVIALNNISFGGGGTHTADGKMRNMPPVAGELAVPWKDQCPQGFKSVREYHGKVTVLVPSKEKVKVKGKTVTKTVSKPTPKNGDWRICASSQSTPPTSSTTPLTTVPVVPATKCPNGQNVVLLNGNKGNKVLEMGLPKGPNDTVTLQKAVKAINSWAAHDPRVLKLYYNTAFKGVANHPPITVPWQQLMSHGCYTAKAHDDFEQLLGAFGTASMALDNAPSTGANTGVAAGGGEPFVEAIKHISGNLWAVKIHLTNGNTFWVLFRCGNVVVTSGTIPGIHQGPPPPPRNQQLKNCRQRDHDPSTDTTLCDPFPHHNGTWYPPQRGSTPGATHQGVHTRQQQGPSDTPNPSTGSERGPNIPPIITNPPKPPPHKTPTTGNPCTGIPGDPGSNCTGSG